MAKRMVETVCYVEGNNIMGVHTGKIASVALTTDVMTKESLSEAIYRSFTRGVDLIAKNLYGCSL